MTTAEITHIDKPDRYSQTDAIRAFNGPGWERPLTLAQAVAWAKRPGNKFIVRTQWGTAVDVVVATSARGLEYLRTRADNTLEDNLLSLPPISPIALYALTGR